MIGSEGTDSQPGRIDIRHSIDHKAEAEGLRGELSRTKSYHEIQIKDQKRRTCAAIVAATASIIGTVTSLIYAIKKCT